MEDYYIKFNIDEMRQQTVFAQFKEIKAGEKSKMIIRAFPMDVLAEKEPKILEMVAGEIIGVYYERRGKDSIVSEIQNGISTVPIAEEDVDWIEHLVKEICINEKYDDLLKPPTVDEQVEDFIKEFFENDDTEPLEQKDFLAEFFSDIEGEADSDEEESTEIRDVVADHFATVEEQPLQEKDFLAEFFAELEDDQVEQPAQ